MQHIAEKVVAKIFCDWEQTRFAFVSTGCGPVLGLIDVLKQSAWLKRVCVCVSEVHLLRRGGYHGLYIVALTTSTINTDWS
jgi:hypothetical protein